MVDDDSLVLAMPRRELFKVAGFTRRLDFTILESLADDCWFAAPATLVDNLDAKEVRLGLIATRPGADGTPAGQQFLVSEHGVALHATPIPPEVGQLGPGLRALRQLALVAGRQLLGSDSCNVELIGYCNDDALAECRQFFILVYQLRAPVDCPAPAEMAWVASGDLRMVPLDPVSALVVPGLA